MDIDENYEDAVGNRGKKSEIIEIETDFVDLTDPELNAKRKKCPATLQQSLKDLDEMLHTFDTLIDPDKIQNFLVGLTIEERSKLNTKIKHEILIRARTMKIKILRFPLRRHTPNQKKSVYCLNNVKTQIKTKK